MDNTRKLCRKKHKTTTDSCNTMAIQSLVVDSNKLTMPCHYTKRHTP